MDSLAEKTYRNHEKFIINNHAQPWLHFMPEAEMTNTALARLIPPLSIRLSLLFQGEIVGSGGGVGEGIRPGNLENK